MTPDTIRWYCWGALRGPSIIAARTASEAAREYGHRQRLTVGATIRVVPCDDVAEFTVEVR